MNRSPYLPQFSQLLRYRKIAKSWQFKSVKTALSTLWSVVVVAALSMLMTAECAHAQAKVPVPAVSLAPDVGSMWNKTPLDLSTHGLIEQEYFFEGTTTAKGAYKSRMIVRRPSSARFNGTVIVELMNASSGFDIDVDFISLLPLMDQEGYAYVAITTQQVSVNFLKKRDPNRYGSLSVGDNLWSGQPAAHEIFSQGAKALLANGNGVDPLGGLKAKRLITVGQSQSSDRLTTYINTIHGITHEPIFSGYILHSGPSGGAPTRFPVPILKLNSENEAPSYYSQRSVADSLYRYWEVPGSSHQPLEGNDYAQALLVAGGQNLPACPFPFQGPGGPVGTDQALRAAVHDVDNWIATNEAPPQAPLISMVPKLLSKDGTIQRDKYGNALGGIRMPQQVVPTGRNTPSYGCIVNLFPQWDAFDGGADPAKDWTDIYTEPSSPKALYGSHVGYVNLFTAATADVYKAGFILGFDAIKLVSDAVNSNIAK